MKDNSSLKQQYRGSRSIACHPAPWWLSPTPVIDPQTLEKQGKSVEAEPDPDNDDDWDSPSASCADGDESDAANEFHWANLSDCDRDYLTGPRVYPSPCPWCGGRYRHNRLCDALRASWEPSLPFGMYKGKPLSAVPREYLEWLVSCSAGISGELRNSIKLRLQGDRSDE